LKQIRKAVSGLIRNSFSHFRTKTDELTVIKKHPNYLQAALIYIFASCKNKKTNTDNTVQTMIKKTVFFLLLFSSVSAYPKNDRVGIALKELDEYIEKRSDFEIAKKERIRNLERKFSNINSSLTDKYNLYNKLYTEYQSYKYDSAYIYAERMLQHAQKLNNPNMIAESKIALAFSCVSAGLYKEASEISNSIDTVQVQTKYKADLYSFLSILYINMADFSGAKPYYTMYRDKSFQYCQISIALLEKEKPEAIMAEIRKCQLLGDYAKAISIAKHFIATKKSGLHDYAIVASTLGYFYQVKKDTVKSIEYFAKAAIADIKMGTKETAAMRQLAELLYDKGDVQRAYDYAILALDDANFYNAKQRKIEVGRILPIIETGRFEIIKQQKDKLLIYSGMISVLFILFMIATFIILKQKKRLDSARLLILQQNKNLLESNEELTQVQKEISKQNIDLIHINEKLKEAHRIKDEYIGYFFSTNSTYLEKIEDYRKMVARKIRNRQFDELAQLGDASGLRKEREEMFALFDQIFMKLFPDFVSRYNMLFNEEDRVSIKSDGTLTPEIRIFALIRLGITESERIAKFLDFSLSTVKNYKTKVKNRSIIANELFEHKIMEIESVKTEISEVSE
jgi:tetratricopeptide (TPR) repeat protein